MVATRRGTVIEPSAESEDSGAQQTSAESSAAASQRQTRGTKAKGAKATSESIVQDELNFENKDASETPHKTIMPEHNLPFKGGSKNTSSGDTPSDGEASEAESTTSTRSGLQAPSVERTRNRKAIVSSQRDRVRKVGNPKNISASKHISESQEEADISEAESNCSISRRTRSRQSISRLRINPAFESQTDDISDTESCCSVISAGQNTNTKRVSRSRIAKSQVEALPPMQDFNRESPSECQIVTKNKAEDLSDAESWCSGFSAGPTLSRVTRAKIPNSPADIVQQKNDFNKMSIPECQSLTKSKSDEISDTESWHSKLSPDNTARRLTNNSPTKAQNRTKHNLVVHSKLASLEEASMDTNVLSVIPTSVSRSSRRKPFNQSNSESQSRSEVESQGDDLQVDVTLRSPKVTEKRRTRATARSKLTTMDQLVDESKAESMFEALESEKDFNLKATHCKDVVECLPQHTTVIGSIKKQEVFSKKGNKIVLEPQIIDTGATNVDDGEIIKVIESDALNTDNRSKNVIDSSKLEGQIEPMGKLWKNDDSILLLTSGDEGEISDAGSEDETQVCFVESSKEKTFSTLPAEDSALSGNEMFIIDKAPGLGCNKKFYIDKEKANDSEIEVEEEESFHEEAVDEDNFIDEDESEDILQKPKAGFVLSTTIDTGLSIKDLGGLYISFDGLKQTPKSSSLKVKEKKHNQEVLKRSIITPDFEKKECVPPYSESIQQLKKKRREERAKTTGDGWFGMKAPELTDELKNDLKALKMRSAIDPKRFYKKNDREGFPKYFQVGTVVDSAVDFYHSRIPKKQRKRTIVEELLADSEFRRFP
ncbi:deoxynucleotidyltransferase terminal-interacting protein 2 [Lissotriton helveticus]